MAVSKRTRYEVLRRDAHTCRYCGASAPEVKLTVDHVTPVALGGSDDPSNLVAACRDCNYGKASSSPDDAIVQQVGEDAMRWAAAIQQAAKVMQDDIIDQYDRHEWFAAEWSTWDAECEHLPDGWGKSIDHWLGAGLTRPILVDCLNIAILNRNVRHEAVFAYMGGIARKRIEELHDSARALIAAEESTHGS